MKNEKNTEKTQKSTEKVQKTIEFSKWLHYNEKAIR